MTKGTVIESPYNSAIVTQDQLARSLKWYERFEGTTLWITGFIGSTLALTNGRWLFSLEPLTILLVVVSALIAQTMLSYFQWAYREQSVSRYLFALGIDMALTVFGWYPFIFPALVGVSHNEWLSHVVMLYFAWYVASRPEAIFVEK